MEEGGPEVARGGEGRDGFNLSSGAYVTSKQSCGLQNWTPIQA